MSSMLGLLAAVIAIVSPSQLRPPVHQRMSISGIAGCRWVFLPYGMGASAISVHAPSADPRQLLSCQHRDDPLAADGRPRRHHPNVIGDHFADVRGAATQRV